jgi:hypothetical protein
VDLAEVDVVGAQEAKARLEVLAQRTAAAVTLDLAVGAVAQTTLRRDDEVISAAPSSGRRGIAEELFSGAEAVRPSGVEEGDSEVERLAGGGDRPLPVDRAPVATGRSVAECDSRDARAAQAELNVFHRITPL